MEALVAHKNFDILMGWLNKVDSSNLQA